MSDVGYDLMQRLTTQVIADHHDAFLVELFGADASGLPAERLSELVAQGLIPAQNLNGLTILGMENECDYFEFLLHANHHIGRNYEDSEALAIMRGWGIDDWKVAVDASITQARADMPTPELDSGVGVVLPRPDPPPPSTRPPIVPQVPPGLTPNETYGYVQSVNRAGEFARGLGQQMGLDLENKIREEWYEEKIVAEADPEKRTERLDVIREEVAREMIESRDARALAARLANRTGMYAHNWLRIAKTELQGAYNDAVILEGVDLFGEDCQIARIHESGACRHCQRLFGPIDNPIVFSVKDLLANGTNVGKPANDWRATIWPIHPNCRCDTRMVPPGMTIVDGDMVMTDE